MTYDGIIRINTNINTAGIVQGMSEIKQVIERSMSSSRPMRGAEQEVKQLGDSFSETAKKASELQPKMDLQKDARVPTKEYSDLQKEFDLLQKKLISVYDSQERFLATGGKEESSTYKKMVYDADTLERKLQSVERSMESLVESGRAFTLGKDSDVEYMKRAEENIKNVLDRVEERQKKEAQTPPELLQPKYGKPVDYDAIRNAQKEVQSFIDAYASGGQSAQEFADKSNEAIASMSQELSGLKEQQKELEGLGIGLGFEKYDENVQRIAEIEAELKNYRRGLIDTESSSVRLGDIMKNAFRAAGHALISLPIHIVKKGISGLASAFHGFFNTVRKMSSSAFGYFKKMAGKAISNVSSYLKKATASMFGFGKSTKKTNNTLEKGFKAILKYGLGIRSFYILVNKFRTAVKEGFKNLAQFSEGTNTALSMLKSSLTQLKNSLATAFNPILTAAAPALTSLINMVSRAATYVGMLFAALTGEGTFTKAKEVQEDYAAGLKDSADAAKDAEKATNGYLSGLDEVKKYDDGSGSSSKDSGGYKAPTPGEMFEEVPIENSIKNFADKIRSLIQSEDWESLGAYMADRVNAGMQKLYDAINWETVGSKITYFVNAFTDTFNSLVDNLDWDLMGRTVGAGINTIINSLTLLIDGIDWENLGKGFADGVNGLLDEVNFENLGSLIGKKIMILPNIALGFVKNLDWSALGTAIGDSLNGVVEAIDLSKIGELLGVGLTGIFQSAIDFSKTFDWVGLGTNISNGINNFFDNFDAATVGKGLSDFAIGILDSIITAIEGVEWQKIGEKIDEMSSNINWDGLADRLSEGIGAALGGLAALLWGIIKDSWNDAVKWWHDVAYEDGKFTIEGLLDGIWEEIKNIGQWIYDHIFKPFVDGFKKAFGIHSPSTVMAEQGNYIISGLLNGLKNNIGKVIDWLKNIPIWFKEKFDKARDKVHEAFNGIGEWFEGKFGDAYKKATGAFQNVKKFFGDVWSGIKDAFGNISDWFKDKFSAAWQAVKDVFSAGGQIFDGIKDGILQGLKAVINALIDGINTVITIPFNGINFALRNIKGVNIMGFKPFDWIQTIDVPQIPRLATGAVIPPNREFLAVLGDQKHGTNIEAPEGLIRKIVREETQGMQSQQGGKAVYSFIAQINRRVVFNEVIEEGKLRQTIHGRNPFELT